MQNYPNPLETYTLIRYVLHESSYVRLEVFDQLGRPVKLLVDRRQSNGGYEVYWEGTDNSGKPVGSGIYYYRLAVGPDVGARRMLVSR